MSDGTPWQDTPLTDARSIRALAHPARLAILERLQVDGPATATECAEVTELSPSACSYHLRLLSRYGFVRAASSRGDSRERLWEAVVRSFSFDAYAEERPRADLVAADIALSRTMLDSSSRRVLAWQRARPREPRAWRQASFVSNSSIRVTVSELEDVVRQMRGLIRPYLHSSRTASDAPEDARLVHVGLRLVPQVR